MKRLCSLALLMMGVFSTSSLMAEKGMLNQISDSLLLVTDRGNYSFDIISKTLTPSSSFSCLSYEESTELISPFDQTSITFSYESREGPFGSFLFWRMMIHKDSSSREYMNFETKPQGSGYILYPMMWSNDSSSVYLRSENGDAVENEQGIWKSNLTTGETICILPKERYTGLPCINRTRTHLFFISREGNLCSLDLSSGMEETLVASCSVFKLSWMRRESSVYGGGNPCAVDDNQPVLHSPFQPETSFCVTRIGYASFLTCDEACTPSGGLCSASPFCEGHCEAGCVNCRDAVDMDVSNESAFIIASCSGVVVRAQQSCPIQGMGQGYGFGYHVVIRHGDEDDENAPETLYAHLDAVFVEEGELVFLGQPIGLFGNTQTFDCDEDGVLDCDCGDSETFSHLHFEYHEGSSGLYGTSDIMLPVFVDIGDCVPQPNYSYESGYEEMSDEYIQPSSDYTFSIEVNCNGTSYVTFTGETCGCCTSSWLIMGEEVSGDELVVPVVSAMISEWGDTEYIAPTRMVTSLCLSQGSFADAPVPVTSILGECLYGCMNPEACNYDEDATGDDGSCDFSCLASCEDADINGDQIVNIFDLTDFLFLLGGSGEPNMPGDLTGDGNVLLGDFLVLLNYFGEICPD